MNDSDSAWALLALRSAPGSPSRVTWQGSNSPENAIARLDFRGMEYMVRQDRIIIGRRTSREKIDVNMGHSAYISRHHLEIYYRAPHFYMKCISKNGIFVDGMFVRNDAEALTLPKSCIFRFPSTTIKLNFQSLINEEPIDLKVAQGGNFKPPTQSPQPVIKDGCDQFRSQPQSPADTISAANSCPTSPRPSTKWHTSRTQPNSPQTQAIHHNCNNTNNFSMNNMGYVEVLDQNFMDASEVVLDTNGNSTMPGGMDGNNHHPMLVLGGHSQPPIGYDVKPVAYLPHYEQAGPPPSTSSHSRLSGEDGKPPFSYAQLIVQAISAAPDKQLTLNGIYSYITRNYPYYKTADKGWQNSIRHNLSLNRYFVKVPRNHEEPGKGSFWRIETTNETKLLDQAYRRRRKRENSNNSINANSSNNLNASQPTSAATTPTPTPSAAPSVTTESLQNDTTSNNNHNNGTGEEYLIEQATAHLINRVVKEEVVKEDIIKEETVNHEDIVNEDVIQEEVCSNIDIQDESKDKCGESNVNQ